MTYKDFLRVFLFYRAPEFPMDRTRILCFIQTWFLALFHTILEGNELFYEIF